MLQFEIVELFANLLERWRPEMHSFQFPCRKTIITLEGVALIIDFQIYKQKIIKESNIDMLWLCYQLLGASLDKQQKECNGNKVKLTWLMTLINLVPLANATAKKDGSIYQSFDVIHDRRNVISR